jgi:lipoprotein-anchoring transpeptidase ErfK/SrfK
MLRRLLFAFVFAAFVSPALAGTVSIVVDISNQSMSVSVDGVTQYNWDVSTGKKGYRTPTGSYAPTRMHKEYYSKKYDNAPMPYAIFFHGGYAIHGTTYEGQLGSPASHGCVRLLTANAKTLYALVKEYGAGNTHIRVKS